MTPGPESTDGRIVRYLNNPKFSRREWLAIASGFAALTAGDIIVYEKKHRKPNQPLATIMRGDLTITVNPTPALDELLDTVPTLQDNLESFADSPLLETEARKIAEMVAATHQTTDEARDIITGIIVDIPIAKAIKLGNAQAVQSLKKSFGDFDTRCNDSRPLHQLAIYFMRNVQKFGRHDMEELFPIDEQKFQEKLRRRHIPVPDDAAPTQPEPRPRYRQPGVSGSSIA